MKRSTILVIEDDLDDQEFISKIVKENYSKNCSIEFCNDGRQALAYLKTAVRKPRLIVSDINMPGLNGLELKTRINSEQQLRDMHIPFVFMSTSVSVEMIKRAEELNVHGYFSKGASYQEFTKNLTLIVDYWCTNQLPIN